MDLKEILKNSISKNRVNEIVDDILANPEKIKALMECYFDTKSGTDLRASWVLSYVARKNHKLVESYYTKVINHLKKDIHTGILRNTIRIFEDVEIPKKIEGSLYALCLDLIIDTKMPVAVGAFSISVATKIAMKHHALKSELREVLILMEDHGTAAFQYRRTKTLKALTNSATNIS